MELVPRVDADPGGSSHRVFLTANQKREQVGDGDRKFCHRGDSIEAKTGRLVQAYGGIGPARAAAATLLGHLTKSTYKGILPPPPLLFFILHAIAFCSVHTASVCIDPQMQTVHLAALVLTICRCRTRQQARSAWPDGRI